GAAGYRAVAPDQRGYSPGVRPDPSRLAAYGIDRLVADVLDLAAASGHGTQPFHLVGPDWGGQGARITPLPPPHPPPSPPPPPPPRPRAEAGTPPHPPPRPPKPPPAPPTATRLLEDGGRRLRRQLRESHVPEAAVEEYLSVLGDPKALEAALAWYRAAGALANMETGPVTVPTLSIWGGDDQSMGPGAAEGPPQHAT